MALGVMAVAVALLLAATSAVAGEDVESVEDAAAAVNTGISIMLLGSVGFMMSLFYLVNHHDEDMKKYSWQVISSTISIFSAVLLFQAVNGMLEEFVLEGHSWQFKLIAGMVHMLCWFVMLQLALAYISGAIGSTAEEREKTDLKKMRLMLKSWAVLLGHITGFAAINAFAVLQQDVPRHPLSTFLVAPIAWGFVILLGHATDFYREKLNAGDGKVDACEEAWDEETEETEDDVVGLVVSFMVVQTLRFLIGGWLPNSEGEDPEALQSKHSDFQVLLLFSAGLIFAILEVLRLMYVKAKLKRFTPQLRNVVAMTFSWCLFFSADWFISGHFFRMTEGGVLKTVILALFVTAISLSMIWTLDQIADDDSTDAKADKAIRAVVQALAILVGFSWERAFDTGVGCLAENVTLLNGAVTKLILAVVLAATVIPAWRIHILPTIIAYEEQEEAEEEAEEREEEEGGKKEDLESANSPNSPGNGSLSSPLLKAKPVSPSKSNLDGLGEEVLKAKIKDYRAQIRDLKKKATGADTSPGDAKRARELDKQNAELKKRNEELEGLIGSISSELNGIQELADLLTN